MERNIVITGCNHLIKGEWTVEGMDLYFKGEAINSASKLIVSRIDYRFPYSFQRTFGAAAMEYEIISTIKDYLEQKA